MQNFKYNCFLGNGYSFYQGLKRTLEVKKKKNYKAEDPRQPDMRGKDTSLETDNSHESKRTRESRAHCKCWGEEKFGSRGPDYRGSSKFKTDG